MFGHHPKLQGTLIGAVVTVLCSVYFFGVNPGNELELLTFDYRVRACSTLEPKTPIVHLDIDDNALERVGRWPWRRDQLADIVRTLDELGAGVIAIDLLLSEHESPFISHPRYSRDADVELDVRVVGELSEQNVFHGDLELADAIASAGNVFLPIQLDVRASDEPGDARERIKAMWGEPGGSPPGTGSGTIRLTTPDALRKLHIEDSPANRKRVDDELLRLRMRDRLLNRFTLTDDELAALLDVELSRIVAVVAGVKSGVARELVGACFTGVSPPKFEIVLETVLGDQKDKNNPDRKDVLDAYRRCLGLAAANKFFQPLDPAVAAVGSRAVQADPPYFSLGRVARDVCAVNFETDVDGATRRVPLLIDYQGCAVKQLGFAVACDVLGLDADGATLADNHTLTIPRRDGSTSMAVPLDGHGNLIINWTKTAKHWRDFGDFPHITAAKLWAIIDARRTIHGNEVRIAHFYADVVAVSKGEMQVGTAGTENEDATRVHGDHAFRVAVNDYIRQSHRVRLARLRGELAGDDLARARQELQSQQTRIDQEHQAAVSFIRRMCEEIAEIPPEEFQQDPQLREDADRFKRALGRVDTDIAALEQANQALEESIASLKRELGPLIKDKYVFLGFAATAAGDIVATPIDPRTNGVMCHAHVLDSFLQDQFIAMADRPLEVLVCLVLGIFVGWITAVKGPRIALLTTVAVLVAYTLVNSYLVFMWMRVWLSLAGVLATVVATWAVVTLFRQLTAERERRFFAKQLSQYTSPAVAARIAESPEAAQAFKTVQTREMTCFFSDLQGFTTITEQEDPEVVQYVLNSYLDRMSQAIWSQRGLVNKFMGDGIMAFFNSSVDPLPEHQRVACEASLITLSELDALRTSQRQHAASPIFDNLRMRVGVASGMCKNGDLGSDLKADYTVIGDIVNLAARLEPANKVFGTQIMVSGPTRQSVEDRYEFRYLAELQVKGKAKTVPAYELVCRKGELTDDQRAYIERFEAGVALYKQRKWDECIVHFTRLLARKFDDLGAGRYIDACQEFKVFPPGDDWKGALELKEK